MSALSVLRRLVPRRTSHRSSTAGVGGFSARPPSTPVALANPAVGAGVVSEEVVARMIADADRYTVHTTTHGRRPEDDPVAADRCTRCGIDVHRVHQCPYPACTNCSLAILAEPHTFRAPAGAVELWCEDCCPMCSADWAASAEDRVGGLVR